MWRLPRAGDLPDNTSSPATRDGHRRARPGRQGYRQALDGDALGGGIGGGCAGTAGRWRWLPELEVKMFREAQAGKLAGRHLGEAALDEARRRARDAKNWDLTPRQLWSSC